ncbi:MAG: LexA family transcriptional regulator [Hydrogenobacter sp.]
MRNGIFDTQKFVKALGEVQKKRGWSIRHIANRFAEFAEISPESAHNDMHRYKSGRAVPESRKKITALAKALDVPIEYLINDEFLDMLSSSKLEKELVSQGFVPVCTLKKIPVVSFSYTGIISNYEHVLEGAERMEEMPIPIEKRNHRIVAFVIEGDSMYPRLIEGDIIYVDLDMTPKVGDTVVAQIEGVGIVVRIVKAKPENGRGKWILRSWDDLKYPDIVVEPKKVIAIAPQIFVKHTTIDRV